MKVTITHNYGANEKQGCWNLSFSNETSGWAGDGLCKVKGTASLDLHMLTDRLSKDGYVHSKSMEAILTYLNYQSMGMSTVTFQMVISQIGGYGISQASIDKASQILNGVAEFCDRRKQTATKTSYSFCDAFAGGNEGSFHSAKKKVMKTFSLDSIDVVYSQLKSFLKNKGLI